LSNRSIRPIRTGSHVFDDAAGHLNEAIANSKLQIIPDAGHFSWSDQPELFAEMITNWVKTGHTSL